MSLEFKITAEEGQARIGILNVNGKRLDTPNFIYAATYGAVNLVSPEEFQKVGIKAVMVNTFQLARSYLLNEPSTFDEIVHKGISRYMRLNNEMTWSDSGGFQVMSYGDSRVDGTGKIAFPSAPQKKNEQLRQAFINDHSVIFTSETEKIELTPEIVMKLQQQLQTDIAFAFDQCHTKRNLKETQQILERTHAWEQRSLNMKNQKQALYGIVHGGQYQNLRQYSARHISNMNFDGLAIGGYLGDSKKEMHRILDWTVPALDRSKPRHLLGIGQIDDLFEGVTRGIDTFDCVEVTRLGRHNCAFVHPSEADTPRCTLALRSHRHKDDENPLSKFCTCNVCTTMTRSELLKLREHNEDRDTRQENRLLYMRYLTVHNVTFIANLLKNIRIAIKEHTFTNLKKEWLTGMSMLEDSRKV